MTINENSGTIIPLAEAISYTIAFQKNNPNSTKAFFVGLEKINMILKQENCIGIRIYNGYNETSNKNNFVLVGVDIKGEDITEGIILEDLFPCPPHCSKLSPLIDTDFV